MKAFKTRIYPTIKQIELIEKTFGCCRFVYNKGLECKKVAYEKDKANVSVYELMKRLTQQKKEFEWLKEVEAQALQQSLLDLQSAYVKFFHEHKGFPKFRKKGEKESYRTLIPKYFSKRSIYIPKVGIIKTAERIRKKWIIKNATISKRAGLYFVSILIEYNSQKIIKSGEVAGIDLGIKDFAILSNGTKYKNIKSLKQQEDKLARLQRNLSHTQKGSNNRKNLKTKIARLHLHIANKRNDYLHKISTEIINRYSLIAIENLNVKGMIQNHKLAKNIADCSWSEFVRQLEYKANWYNCELRKIGRFEPSSKLCSVCGYKMVEMPLNIRKWECPNCHTVHDRDINAANNILKIALSGREEEPVDTVNGSSLEQENFE